MLGFISKPIAKAWGYAEKAISWGIEKAESFVDVSVGGLVVSEKEWSEAFDLAEQAKEIWASIPDIPGEYVVKKEFSVLSEFDWRDRYVMKMKTSVKDMATGQLREEWITVESDELLTRNEWDELAREIVGDEEATTWYTIYEILEYNFYTRT